MTRLIGSILMIVGVSIGGGMLALPVTTVVGGFWHASLLMIAIWCIMTTTAFLILEVNLTLPAKSNLISMVKLTLGPYGTFVCWLSYLLLLYSLLCAYTAGGSDMFQGLIQMLHVSTSKQFNALLFILIFSTIVYLGIQVVDHINRLLMALKLLAFFAMLSFTLPNIHPSNLATGHIAPLTSAVMIVTTSFGYAIIVPSLCAYLKHDVRQLRLAILVGSSIPLLCYLAWNYLIQGAIPKSQLIAIAHSGNVVSQLTRYLSLYSHYRWLVPVIHLFTSVALLTSFLGVSLALSDFLSDGLQIDKTGLRKVFLHLLTFLPPLAIILFYPQAFIAGIRYAGINCVILLILLPTLMAWSTRYLKKRSCSYQVWGGKPLLASLLGLSALLLIIAIVEH